MIQFQPGPEPLVHLVYVSRASTVLGAEELRELVARSRLRNQVNGITGLLLHHEGRYVQLLEGEESAVLTTYERIRGDSRHTEVRLLAVTPISERHFDDWAMGLADSEQLSSEKRLGFVLVTSLCDERDTRDEGARVALRLLREFASGAALDGVEPEGAAASY